MPHLVVKHPDGTTERHDLGERPIVTVGRETSNDIVLTDPRASRKQFYIERRGDVHELVNVSTTRGTQVGGEKIDRVPLRGGEAIVAGETDLVFEPDVETSVAGGGPALPTMADETPPADDPRKPRTETNIHNLLESVIFSKPEEEVEQEPDLLATTDVHNATMLAAFDAAAAEPSSTELRKRFLLLQEIGSQMVGQLNLPALLEMILEKVFEVLPADNGLILLVDPETGERVPMAARGPDALGDSPGRLRVSESLLSRAFERRVGILSADTTSDARFQKQDSIMAFNMRSVLCVPLIYHDVVLGAVQVDSQQAGRSFSRQDLDLLTMIANQAAVSVHTARLHDQMVAEETHRAQLERYFSPQIASKIAANEIELDAGGSQVEATVLFSDIRSFTTLSEQTDPGSLVRFLNTYLGEMVEIVFDCNGSLDKYIGDALVAVFGSPSAHPDDAWNAARCAQRMVERVRQAHYEAVGQIAIGIGLHCGRVIHGNIGSEKIMQYTVIGDVVNTTSRLSDIAEPNQIVLSPAMQRKLGECVETRPLGARQLKGKGEPMEVFELVRVL